MGRAEAMRQSMLDLIDHGERQEAHPAFWAPFALVGEGAAARESSPVIPCALQHANAAVQTRDRKERLVV